MDRPPRKSKKIPQKVKGLQNVCSFVDENRVYFEKLCLLISITCYFQIDDYSSGHILTIQEKANVKSVKNSVNSSTSDALFEKLLISRRFTRSKNCPFQNFVSQKK